MPFIWKLVKRKHHSLEESDANKQKQKTVLKMRFKSEVVALVFITLLRRVQSFKPLAERESCMTVDNRYGVCVLDCPPDKLIKDIKNICGFKKSSPITCCPDDAVELKFYTIDRVCRQQFSLKIRKEPPFHSFAYPAFFPALGDEHPHMVVLGWTIGDQEYDWDCGGSLIHPLYVLTAAHCLTNKGELPNVVRLGTVDLMKRSGETYVIRKWFKHPAYREDLPYNDIAILQIDTVGIEGALPRVACLWTHKLIPHKNLLTMGFGAPEFGKVNNLRLYQGNLSFIETDDCKHHYYGTEDLPDGLIDSQVCAFDPELKLDTCQGDSGGPLQFDDWYFNRRSKTYEKKAYLVGITSLGKICRNGVPGIYTRIYPYLDWIERMINRSVVDSGEGYRIFVTYY